MSEVKLPYGLTPPDAIFELAASVRDLVEQMVRIDESHPEVVAAQQQCAEIAERLRGVARRGLAPRMAPEAEHGPEDRRPYYQGDASRWHYNPFHPRIELESGGERRLRARCELGLAHEGPPGCVHGGFIAMLFDQVLGHANILYGLPGLTARLTVRYRRPTPLYAPLVFETEPPDVQGERRCLVKGSLLHAGLVTATGVALFARPAVPLTAESLLGSQP